MPCNSKRSSTYHRACARDLHENMIYIIRTLNFVYLIFFFFGYVPPLDPRCPWAKEMSQHIYKTYVSDILDLGGEQGCRNQRR